MDFLKTLIKASDAEHISIADDGMSSGDIAGFIDSGSYTLNALLSGSIYKGYASNKITIMAGESSTGKTYYALSLLKQYLDSDPKRVAIIFSTESDHSRELLINRGIDPKRVIINELDTIEKFKHSAMKMLLHYESMKPADRPPMLFILDSLGMLSTSKEMEDTGSGSEKRDMTKAQQTKGAFRSLTLKMGRLDVPMIMTNHVYDVIGAYIPTKKMGGGQGPVYAASQILYLSKKKAKDGDAHIGNLIKVVLNKSRFTIEGKSVETLLRFDTGLSRYYGLLDLAEKFGIVTKAPRKPYVFPNGLEGTEDEVYSTPEKFFTKEVLDLIDVKCQDEFLYGKTRLTNEDNPSIEISDEVTPKKKK